MASNQFQAANSNDLPQAHLVDSRGNPYVVSTLDPSGVSNELSNAIGSGAGGGDSGGHAVNIGKLETRMNHAFQWLTILSSACGAVFLFVMGILWSMHSDIGSINSNVSAQTATITDISRAVDRIETRLDGQNDQSQTGSRAGQAGSVHRGTRPGTRG